MVKGIIYKATNKTNGKAYVGQTVQTIEKRMMQHMYGHKTYFDCAIDRFGIDNFEIEIIDTADSIDELNEKEKYYISSLNTMLPNGYNLCEGGGNTTGYHHKEESKRKMSIAKSKMYIGENNPFYGKKHSEETRKKISESKKYEKNCTARKVRCVETGEIFDCILYAAQKYDIAATHITRVCRGRRKTTGGFHWEYAD